MAKSTKNKLTEKNTDCPGKLAGNACCCPGEMPHDAVYPRMTNLYTVEELPLCKNLPGATDYEVKNNPYFFPGDTDATNLILRLDAYLQVTPEARLSLPEITLLAKIVYRQLSLVERLPNIQNCPFARPKTAQ